jgi:galactose mutarotase-like enzyme
MAESLWISSGQLQVEVRPAKGADIASIIDRTTGVDVLARSPWGRRELATALTTGDSQLDWLARYGGGWQQLIPNAGQERVVDGVRRGYHGEAAVVGWQVRDASDSGATLTADLITAPLHLTRELRVDGPTLTVTDSVANASPEPVPVMWVEHPGFGAPFIDEHCTLTTSARSILADAVEQGNLLAADTRSAFPPVSAVPGPGSGQSAFGCLSDFAGGGWFAIESPTAGFGIRIEWDTEVFPHAWFWQECNASAGFPWHRRAYVIAVEPANVIPGDPSPGCPERGQAPILAGLATWTSAITLTRTSL